MDPCTSYKLFNTIWLATWQVMERSNGMTIFMLGKCCIDGTHHKVRDPIVGIQPLPYYNKPCNFTFDNLIKDLEFPSYIC